MTDRKRKLSGKTPLGDVASLIRAYVERSIKEDYGDDDVISSHFLAVREAVNDEEVCHLGRAMLARVRTLADPPYQLGGPQCDPVLMEIAEKLHFEY